MCNHCTADPRDEIIYASAALRGVVTLLTDVNQNSPGPRKGLFEATMPGDLLALLEPIQERIDAAAHSLQAYVPRA